jgi:non-lysosomal glucosylceramidase
VRALVSGSAVTRGQTPLRCLEEMSSSSSAKAQHLFPANLLYGEFTEFAAAGFSAPVVGVIHQKEYPAIVGMPLGGIGTGCLDLETSGLFGLCSIFNSITPRRGAMNWPFLGLNIGGQTWVLTTGQQSPEKGTGAAANKPRPADLVLPGVKIAKNIRYWGHYPVADLEYEIDAPISVGLRAWSPLIPGDAPLSNTPAAMFEVHIRNTSGKTQEGTLAFSFFGPSYDEAWGRQFGREAIRFPLQGVHVTSPRSSYVLGVVGDRKIRVGGGMGHSPEVRFGPKADPADWARAWSQLGSALPEPSELESGSTVATDFSLEPNGQDVIRFVLTWYSPHWMSSGNPANGPRAFRHMYSTRFPDAIAVARLVVEQHASLLRRILAWQQEIYVDTMLPTWMREVLLNMLHTYSKVGLWAAAEPPIGDWCRPEDGLYAVIESPDTGGSSVGSLIMQFYGDIALAYLFPQLALSALRASKAYLLQNTQNTRGGLTRNIGGYSTWSGGAELACPSIVNSTTCTPFCYLTIVDRYRMLHGDEAFTRECYPSVKEAIESIRELNRGPDGIVSMPDHLVANWPGVPQETEIYEWSNWIGIVPHVGGLHLAAIAMAERMAKEVGDDLFALQCREWFEFGQATLETNTWLDRYYLRFFDPKTGERSDEIFSAQLDGQLVAKLHGLKDVFRSDRVTAALETIKETCVAATKFGTVLYATVQGTATQGGSAKMASYGANDGHISAVVSLGLTYIYAGQVGFGLEEMWRIFHNNVCKRGLSWYGENLFDAVTGQLGAGSAYTIRMFLWGAVAALGGRDLAAPSKNGGLIERIVNVAA